MFLHLYVSHSVYLWVRGCTSPWTHPPAHPQDRQTDRQTDRHTYTHPSAPPTHFPLLDTPWTPPRSTSGQYAFYWNTSLLNNCFNKLASIRPYESERYNLFIEINEFQQKLSKCTWSSSARITYRENLDFCRSKCHK